MKIFTYTFLFFSFVRFLVADELKLNLIDLKNIGEIELKELQKFSKDIDIKTTEVTYILQFIKNTNNFDFINYLIENENKNIGSGIKWDENKLSEIDSTLKSKILAFKTEYISFQQKYLKINILHELRVKCIGYISKNKSILINENEFKALLNPMELELFKNSKYDDTIIENEFISAYYEKQKIKRKAFDIKHNLNLQSRLKNTTLSINDIIYLIGASENYLRNDNLDLLKKQINLKSADITWAELLQILELWRTNISYEKHLIEDSQNTQDRLNYLAIQALEICLNKTFIEKKNDLEKIIGAKLYQSIFIEKLELGKIQELNFESCDKTLKVISGFR